MYKFKILCALFLPVSLLGQPIDGEATEATVNLFFNLKNVAKGSLLFGHEDALAYGLNEDRTRWIDEDDRSDVKSVTGSHPAVYGWDIGRLELEDSLANIDDVNFERMKYWIRTGYERGGIITISWHSNNPQTGGDTWDTSGNAPRQVIPGGEKHEIYKEWLDRVADFLLDLKDSNGEFIPVIFRPYHEHTGSWFWWGRNACSVGEYVSLWKFTVEYFRDVRDIHHLLYAYSPSNSGVNNESDYLERYPGDEYVDLFGTDDYGNIYNANQKTAFIRNLKIAANLAIKRDKISALTETGNEKIPDNDWFTTRIVEPIKEDSIARQIAYFLVWRNGRPDHYYAPYPGHQTANDLVNIYEQPFVQLEDELPDLYTTPEVSIIKQLPDLSFEARPEISYLINLDEYFERAASYEIAYASNDTIATLELSGSELSISSTEMIGSGEYRIKALGSNQYLELMFLIDVEEVESEEEEPVLGLEHKLDVLVYPNPTSDFISVKNLKKFISYKIISTDGKVIYSSEIQDEIINVKNLQPGVYTIGLASKDQIIFRHFIKK